MKCCLALLMLTICSLSRAQKHSSENVTLLQAPATESTVDEVLLDGPCTEAEGGDCELTGQTDVWAALRALRDMVVEQRVELRHLTARITAAESQVEGLQRENEAMEGRMTAAERLVEELQMENEAQAVELGAAQQKLSTLDARLTASESRVEQLEIQQGGQTTAMQELQNINEVSKVVFSASLLESGRGNTESTDDYVTLIYKNIFINTGNHYNPVTGYFTAPVRGVYYFSFTGHLAHTDRSMMIRLVKNRDPVVFSGDRATDSSSDAEDNASNTVVVHLEAGDVISLQLHGRVWDDQYHRTTFSGFLLFPL